MERVRRLAPWLTQFVLGAATLVFALIGWKYIADPVHTAATSGITLNSALAVTNMRASFGAFPLACAIIALTCLLFPRLHFTGLCFVATMIGVVMIVRIFGILIDGTASQSLMVLGAEAILLMLSLSGLFIEQGGRRYRPELHG